ncbi:serine hydrolase domain-containing protein [uncultured Lutibacter sp.]|uniref:serine hydrolase domain-containing protein n=1 Tax=uncultured Lutibacter sp. TaxID=437739 RepID=UPI0026084867|nr:serine hydrolase domain-containing protein [uncultured Lutibacter sp.]
MKAYFKFLVVMLIALISVFVFSEKSENVDIKNISSKVSVVKTKKKPVQLEKYSETDTKKVQLKLDSLLKRINKRHDFHGSLLVAKNDKILYSNQIGYADFSKKKPINKTSVFQLASVSKQFTAAAIMLLYERKQIKLTDTVNHFFPDFPYENVTIKNLLNHTAGLPKYFWLSDHLWNKKKAPSNSEMMSLLAKSNVQRFYKPGYKFDYSNTGYFVLASIIEKVTGESFSNFIEDNIFNPLEMKNSYVYNTENDSIIKNKLSGYRLYRGWRHLKINNTVNDAIVGDKNVYTTSEDLFKWTLGLNNGKLLSKESLDLMYSKGETISGKKIPYGFGFRIDPKDENIIYHHGKWNGFSTSLTQYKMEDLVIIVLEHTGYNSMTYLNNKIKKLVTENFKV